MDRDPNDSQNLPHEASNHLDRFQASAHSTKPLGQTIPGSSTKLSAAGRQLMEEPATVPFTPSAVSSMVSRALPTVDGYEILGELGHGGMGVVYQVRERTVQRLVALKTVRSECGVSSHMHERFRARDARRRGCGIPTSCRFTKSASRMCCPITRWPSSAAARSPAAARSSSISTRLRPCSRNWPALHDAHQQGVVHRDLKPSNVLVDEQGEPLVTDFGLAKLPENDVELTRTGDVIGTPAYMVPEQAACKPIGPAVDIWALGVILYELLTEGRPFEGTTCEEVKKQILLAEPVSLRKLRPGVSRPLEAIVLKCLEKEPGNRYRTAEELADDLQRFLRGEPIQARRASLPLRTARAVRRHPRVAISLLFLLVAAAVVPSLMPARADPDAVPNQLRTMLAAGETVTLVDNTGPPRWSRWSFGQGALTASPWGDESLYFTTADASLLELLPGPLPERFRLRAEVRLNKTGGGEAGIFFAYQSHATTLGVEHCYAEFVFREQSLLKGASAQVALQLRRRRERGPAPALDFQAATGTARSFPISPQPQSPRAWRTLELIVTPDAIRGTWDNLVLGELSRAKLQETAERMLEGNGELDPRTECPTSGALGLYVERDAASFRNVVIEPIQ